MWFWWFIFICSLLIPLTMVIVGYLMRKHTPKKINVVIGYRTSRSMKNMDTWKFAHNYCGKLWYNAGKFLLLSVLPMFFVIGQSEDIIGILSLIIIIVQLFFLIASIFPTERALKKNI